MPLKKRLVVLPHRGLVGGSAVLLLLPPMYLMLEKRSKGIYAAMNAGMGIHRTTTVWQARSWFQSEKTARLNLFLNGSEIRREELGSQLAACTNWEIFVEADDSVSYSEAMDAIDQITMLPARSVMLTKLRRKLAEACAFR